ncbi:hypothetical protein niasHS_008891 [Heterodera schachtii]|uniref:Uncharacterized protein n=1 Tax=Heterodera schachtii TaxID=97005 RepID=A0ABD2IVS1_HETSC
MASNTTEQEENPSGVEPSKEELVHKCPYHKETKEKIEAESNELFTELIEKDAQNDELRAQNADHIKTINQQKSQIEQKDKEINKNQQEKFARLKALLFTTGNAEQSKNLQSFSIGNPSQI